MSVGAIITVFALALDPFTQQILQYDTRQVISPALQGTVPRSTLFNEPGEIEDNLVSNALRNAINLGVFGPQYATINANCPTGNCKVNDIHHSVGLCSTCKDATSEIRNDCDDLSDLSTTNQPPCNFTLAGFEVKGANNPASYSWMPSVTADAAFDYDTAILWDHPTIETAISGS